MRWGAGAIHSGALGANRALEPPWRLAGSQKAAGRPVGRPAGSMSCVGLVRDRGLRIRWISRVLLNATNEIKRGVERLVILRIRRDVGLRAGLLVAFGLEVAAQRSLAARVGARFELFRHVLQHLDIGRDALR